MAVESKINHVCPKCGEPFGAVITTPFVLEDIIRIRYLHLENGRDWFCDDVAPLPKDHPMRKARGNETV